MNCDFVKIRFGDLLKTSPHKNHLSELFIQQYPDNENLCVVKTLIHYINKQNHFAVLKVYYLPVIRNNIKGVSKGTLGGWVKTVLSKAGIDMNIFRLHSTHSASTSKAFSIVLAETVLRTTGLKIDCTLVNFINVML